MISTTLGRNNVWQPGIDILNFGDLELIFKVTIYELVVKYKSYRAISTKIYTNSVWQLGIDIVNFGNLDLIFTKLVWQLGIDIQTFGNQELTY